MTPAPLRVAVAQAASVPGDVAANVATATSLVTDAARRGARLVVLPELFLTGYDPQVWTHGCSLALDDPVLHPLAAVAAETGVLAVLGAAVRRAPETSTLSLLVAGPSGVGAPYDKQHLDREERFFTAGDHGASLRVDGWELGLGVCYDAQFPEHARAAAEDGATAYLLAFASFAGSEARRDLHQAARAHDNGMYVVAAGLTGAAGARVCTGGSAVYDPDGRVLQQLGDTPGLLVVELDPAAVRAARAARPLLEDRVDLGRRLTLGN